MMLLKPLVLFMLLINIAEADDLQQTRETLSGKLNNAVKELKANFSSVAGSINTNATKIDLIDEKVQKLILETAEDETNPSVLLHGRSELPKVDCDEKTEVLKWTGSKWECKPVQILSDCTPADDEYRVEQSDGSFTCQKVAKSQSINYYWRHLGYSPKCDLGTGQNAKIYGCHYKNKLNQEILVADSKCSGKVKPNVSNKVCVAEWVVGKFGECDVVCGGSYNADRKWGYWHRTVTCPAGYTCDEDQKPKTYGECNWRKCAVKANYNSDKNLWSCNSISGWFNRPATSRNYKTGVSCTYCGSYGYETKESLKRKKITGLVSAVDCKEYDINSSW